MGLTRIPLAVAAVFLACCPGPLPAQPLLFPTSNRALSQPDGGEKFFVGTTGKPWTTGTFGCVRTDGFQIHEGLDIRCLTRDKTGEPADPILAAAAGTVAYSNSRPGLSNYGKHIILKHQIEGLEIFTVYAHLSEISVRTGDAIKAGQVIGVMGRTSNTRERISKERAHVHFEVTLILNDRFEDWFKKEFPGTRNDHGRWNGRNLAGLDPRPMLLGPPAQDQPFSALRYVRNQTELCRVLARAAKFPWLDRYRILIKRNAVAEKEGIVAYEVALNFNGVPFQLIPRAASEISGTARFQLLSVNEAEAEAHPCRRLVVRKGGKWELGKAGLQLLDLLTY